MKVLYFAWLRDTIGTGQEDIAPPADAVATVADLIGWLKDQSPAHAKALADTDRLRFAVNQDYAKPDTAVKPGDEVAFFPPVTGG
jgi:molybdopterin synthase sulfur carrier subunit